MIFTLLLDYCYFAASPFDAQACRCFSLIYVTPRFLRYAIDADMLIAITMPYSAFRRR